MPNDTERLDWIEKRDPHLKYEDGVWQIIAYCPVVNQDGIYFDDSLRGAIDKAISEEVK